MQATDPAATRFGLRPATWIALAVAALLTFAGWWLTWHLADDAFITYRYLSNAMLGHGLVWNPEPFHAADGNTDFLWSLLLLGVWKVFGVEPPAIANTLALGFGMVTLWMVACAGERIRLPDALHRHRSPLIAVVLLTIATNRAFLASLSSGIGQAFFNCALIAWALTAARREQSEVPRHWFRLGVLAAWAGVSRPEGHLVVVATVLLLVLWSWRRDHKSGLAAMAAAIVPVAAHLVFRRVTYGSWLPCTYYAKSVEPWPAAGVRYCLTFVIEFGLYIWLFVALAWVTKMLARGRVLSPARRDHFGLSAVAGVFLVHFCYYTFRIGGDLFEWRPYTHLVIIGPLVMLVMLRDLYPRARFALLVMTGALLVAQPIPWLKFGNNDGPVAPLLPELLQPLVEPYDRDQAWLNEHILCMRNYHMKSNYRVLVEQWPTREVGAQIPYDGYPTFAAGAVGLVAWVFPHVAMIDAHGLNDWVVAHTPVKSLAKRREEKLLKLSGLFAFFDQDKDGAVTAAELRPLVATRSPAADEAEIDRLAAVEIRRRDRDGDGVISREEYVRLTDGDVERRHAHERSPPPGYLQGFRVNLHVENRVPRLDPRDPPLTADDIRAHERRFFDQIDAR